MRSLKLKNVRGTSLAMSFISLGAFNVHAAVSINDCYGYYQISAQAGYDDGTYESGYYRPSRGCSLNETKAASSVDGRPSGASAEAKAEFSIHAETKAVDGGLILQASGRMTSSASSIPANPDGLRALGWAQAGYIYTFSVDGGTYYNFTGTAGTEGYAPRGSYGGSTYTSISSGLTGTQDYPTNNNSSVTIQYSGQVPGTSTSAGVGGTTYFGAYAYPSWYEEPQFGVANSFWSFTMFFSNSSITGLSQSDPVLPIATSSSGWSFADPIPGLWYDPPLANGFSYSLDGGEFFSVTTPMGLEFGAVDVVTADGVLATLAPGESFAFSTSVSDFSLVGLDPKIDIEDPGSVHAYPVLLDFSVSATKLSIQPIVEPVPLPPAIWLFVGAIGGMGIVQRRLTIA